MSQREIVERPSDNSRGGEKVERPLDNSLSREYVNKRSKIDKNLSSDHSRSLDMSGDNYVNDNSGEVHESDDNNVNDSSSEFCEIGVMNSINDISGININNDDDDDDDDDDIGAGDYPFLDDIDEAIQSIIWKNGDDEDVLKDTTNEDEITQSNSRNKTLTKKKVIIYSHIVININQDGITMFLF